MAERKRYSEEQILKVLGEIEAGASIASVARGHGISDQTIYAWREKYAGMSKSELTQLRAVQDENRRLRHLVAEPQLGQRRAEGVAEGKMVSPGSRRRGVQFLLGRGFPRTSACRVCRLSRPASRHVPKERSPGLKEKVLELARGNPRYGFRRVPALLPGVNLKAVHRIWKEEGLAIRHRKRRKLALSEDRGAGAQWAEPGVVLGLLPRAA